MTGLEDIRRQKIEELRNINTQLTAIINELDPKINQLTLDINALDAVIGDGGVQEEPQQ